MTDQPNTTVGDVTEEIKVTTKMIEAGQAIFAPHIMTIAPVFLVEIYRAMERARREVANGK